MKNRIFAAFLFTIVIAGQTSIANASIIDWMTGNQKDDSVSSNSAMFLTSSGLSLNDVDFNNKSEQVITQDKFLVANNTTNKKPGNSNKFSHENDKKLASQKAVRELVVAASAYSSTPDQTDDTPFITASNTLVHDGIVAANFLPLGTKIRIPKLYGSKIFTVEDRMNKRYWQKIDIWFPDRQSALEFGVKTIKIEIL